MKMLSVEQIRDRLPISRTKLNLMVKRGEFIQPVQVAGQLMFLEHELEEWMSSQPRGLFEQSENLKKHRAENRGGTRA